MDMNDYGVAEKARKTRNYGYILGVLMLIITAAICGVIVYLCFSDLKAVFGDIFSQNSFVKIIEKLFDFIGNFKKDLHFTKTLTTLFYGKIFFFAAAILGFVQGALFKKQNIW